MRPRANRLSAKNRRRNDVKQKACGVLPYTADPTVKMCIFTLSATRYHICRPVGKWAGAFRRRIQSGLSARGITMNDKSNKMTDTVNVTMHSLSQFDKDVSYARVQRNTAYIGNIIDKVREQNRMLDRETLLFTAGLFRNGILELLKTGKAVDVLELGTLYIKPGGSMDTTSPSIGDVPAMGLAFTPSELALESVRAVSVAADVSEPTEPVIKSLYDMHLRAAGTDLSAGRTVRARGKRLKVAGNDTVGVFFAPCDEDGSYKNDVASWVQIPASELIDNTASTLLFNVPGGIESGRYRLIVRTAYGSGSRVNKTVRSGVFADIVSVA